MTTSRDDGASKVSPPNVDRSRGDAEVIDLTAYRRRRNGSLHAAGLIRDTGCEQTPGDEPASLSRRERKAEPTDWLAGGMAVLVLAALAGLYVAFAVSSGAILALPRAVPSF